MIENIRLSFQGIWAHKMRSFLTMLGIIIGIASIISIVSTIKGTNEQIKQNLIGAGNNVTRIQLYRTDYNYVYGMDEGIPAGIPQVSQATYEEILALPNVDAAAVYTRRSYTNYSFYYGNTELSGCPVYGVDNSYFSTCGYSVKEGRMFVPNDLTPIGKTIEYNGVALVVVGVVEMDIKFEPVINSIEEYYTYMGSKKSGAIFLPNVIWPSMFAYDEPEEVAVRVSYTEAMSKVGKDVADLLNTYNTNTNIVYQAEDTLKQAKELQDLSNATNQQLVWIASISLLVGGIGVMNIMLVSVTERTREIGTRKALGATNANIQMQFVVESALICLVGGVIGIILGAAFGYLGSTLLGVPTLPDLGSVALAAGFSLAVGIFFGYYPASKAAKMDPIEALRYE